MAHHRWQLLAPLDFESAILARVLRVPSGFVTDFDSVPRVPVAYWIAGNRVRRASTVHDWLYSIKIVPRRQADAVFFEGMVSDVDAETGARQIPDWVAWADWSQVRAWGWWRWRRTDPRPVNWQPPSRSA